MDPRPLPEGFAMRWPKGTDLVLQLHLHPSGKPEVEQSTIGLYFTDEPPRRPIDGCLLINQQDRHPARREDVPTRAIE